MKLKITLSLTNWDCLRVKVLTADPNSFNDPNHRLFLSSDTNNTWIILSEGIYIYFKLHYGFSPMFLPLYIRLNSLFSQFPFYRLFNERTLSFNSQILSESDTIIFSPRPFSFRMYSVCVVGKLIIFMQKTIFSNSMLYVN